MDSDTVFLILFVAAVLNITVLVLFIRLCSRVKELREAFFVAYDLEKVRLSVKHPQGGYNDKNVIRKKGILG